MQGGAEAPKVTTLARYFVLAERHHYITRVKARHRPAHQEDHVHSLTLPSEERLCFLDYFIVACMRITTTGPQRLQHIPWVSERAASESEVGFDFILVLGAGGSVFVVGGRVS